MRFGMMLMMRQESISSVKSSLHLLIFQPTSDARKNNNAFFSSEEEEEEKQISPRNPLLILFLLLVQTVRTVFSSVFSPHERLLDSRNQRRDFPGVRVLVLRVDGVERADGVETRVEVYASSWGFVRVLRALDFDLRKKHSVDASDAGVVRGDDRKLSVRV